MVNEEQDEPMDVSARVLVRRARSATLATALGGRRQGWPYASLVTVACTAAASPILLLSGLADHTRNLAEDARASLLFEEASNLPNPQTGPRVTLTGRLKPTTDPLAARRFLSRHSGAKLYAGFADFRFYRMTVERAHYVGGFGSAKWLGAKKFLYEAKAAEAVAAAEQRLVKRLNKEQGESLARLLGKRWMVIGLDPEGLDLAQGKAFRRLQFVAPVRSGRGIPGAIEKLLHNFENL